MGCGATKEQTTHSPAGPTKILVSAPSQGHGQPEQDNKVKEINLDTVENGVVLVHSPNTTKIKKR